MSDKQSKKQLENLARLMGYEGPMHKFQEFLDSKPKGYATGGFIPPGTDSNFPMPETEPDTNFPMPDEGTPFPPPGGGGGGSGTRTPEQRARAQARRAEQGPRTPEQRERAQARRDARAEEDEERLRQEEEDARRAIHDAEKSAFRDLQDIYSWDSPDIETPEVQVDQMDVQDDQFIDPNSGQVGAAPDVQTTTADTQTARTPQEIQTAIIEAITAGEQIGPLLQEYSAAVGSLSEGSIMEGAQMDPAEMARLGYSAEQIAQAQQVKAPDARTLQDGELIPGSAVNMSKVEEVLNTEAAQADPSAKATVQGQLNEMLADFDSGNPPPWAASAIRAANTQLAKRGLSASSMAGQAVIQATMEAATPIAMADAQTFAQFEMANLSNRQQTAMLAAQQRAEFLGMEFTQEFQSRVANAAKISDIANTNFSAEVQIALENAQLAQTVDLANLDARSAKLMADLAAMSNLEAQNLSNVQQAAVQNAAAFLQMDMTNLNNEQQMAMFRAEARVQALLTDTATENATRQFNAANENQTRQFMANLISQTDQFNASQTNGMNQFNAGQQNAVAMFKAQMQDQRDQFNASNRLVIDQANARWRQQIATQDNATINEANRTNAANALAVNLAEFNNISQARRDALNFAFTASESGKDRAVNLALAVMRQEEAAASRSQQSRDGLFGALGSFAARIFDNILG